MTTLTLRPRTSDLGAIEALTDRLVDNGFERRAPDRWTAADDADMCASNACDTCGFSPLQYRPFTRGKRYIALSVCGFCQQVSEF